MKRIFLKCIKKTSTSIILTLLIVAILLNINSTNVPIVNKGDTSILLKYSINTELSWNVTWGGGGDDCGSDVAISPNDSIYCAGSTTSYAVGSNDLALVKFSSNGSEIWFKTWGGIKSDRAYGVDIDKKGNIYCVGITDSYTLGSYDLLLIKFAPNGTKLWNTTWGETDADYGYEVAVDSNGFIYCIGETYSYGAISADFVLVKFDPNGNVIWNTTWGGPSTDRGRDLVIGPDGNIYCVGESIGFLGPTYCLAVVKFAPNGTLIWFSKWDGPDEDYGLGITIDSNGYLYCSATTYSYGAGLRDFALVKFNSSNGIIIWNTTFGGDFNDNNFDVVVDKYGYIYCAGNTESFGAGNEDFMLVRFSQDGNKIWNLTWGGIEFDKSLHIVIDDLKSLYLSGDTSSFGMGARDFALLRYDFIPPDPPVLEQISPPIDDDGKIQLKWNNVSDANRYYIYRDTKFITNITGLSPIAQTSNINFMDIIGTAGDYYYVIVAGSHYGNSSISNCVNVKVSFPTTPIMIPGFDYLSVILVLIVIIYINIKRGPYFNKNL
ncbi:MAG: SBBP repeat-containing protein [Candidatus Helarchaeota archaeon]